MTKLKKPLPKVKEKRLKRLTITTYLRGTSLYVKLFYGGKSLALSTGLTCRPKQLNKEAFSIEGNESGTNLLQSLRSDFQRAFTDFLLTQRTPDLHKLKAVVLDKVGADPAIPTLIDCLNNLSCMIQVCFE